MQLTAPATVRRADDRDLLTMLRFIERSPQMGDADITRIQRETWHRMMESQDVTPYLAELDGAAVGYTAGYLVRHLTYGCRPGLLIESMYVDSDHRRRGIATQMIAVLLEDARAQGVRKVQLLTHKRHADDGAHALYLAAGFVAEAEGFRLYLQ